MDEKYISLELFNEYKKRMHDEDNRQNHRLNVLEDTVKDIHDLTSSVQMLAMNMNNLLKEQEKQNERLSNIEKRDGDKWKDMTKYIMTTIVGVIIGVLCRQIGW